MHELFKAQNLSNVQITNIPTLLRDTVATSQSVSSVSQSTCMTFDGRVSSTLSLVVWQSQAQLDCSLCK